MTQCVTGTVYVGPTAVSYFTEQFRKAGITVYKEASQHILIEIPASSWREAEDTLYRKLCRARGYRFASDYRMRPITVK